MGTLSAPVEAPGARPDAARWQARAIAAMLSLRACADRRT